MDKSELQAIKEKYLKEVNFRRSGDKSGVDYSYDILVCGGTGCKSCKSDEVLQKLREVISSKGLENVIAVHGVGCFGLCVNGPIVLIYPYDALYERVKVSDVEEIVEYANENLFKKTLNINDVNKNVDDLIETIYTIIVEEYEEKIKGLPKEVTDEFEKVIVLNIIDRYWTEHINTMSHLREGIGLRGYAQDDPLRAYTMEGFDLFDKMMQNIDKDVTILLIKAEITQNIERKEVSKKQITNDGKDHIKQVPKKVQKIGRNDPCPCGSGKKYKQCCGK